MQSRCACSRSGSIPAAGRFMLDASDKPARIQQSGRIELRFDPAHQFERGAFISPCVQSSLYLRTCALDDNVAAGGDALPAQCRDFMSQVRGVAVSGPEFIPAIQDPCPGMAEHESTGAPALSQLAQPPLRFDGGREKSR